MPDDYIIPCAQIGWGAKCAKIGHQNARKPCYTGVYQHVRGNPTCRVRPTPEMRVNSPPDGLDGPSAEIVSNHLKKIESGKSFVALSVEILVEMMM